MKIKVFHKELKCFGKPCIDIDFDELDYEFDPIGVRYVYFHNEEIDESCTVFSTDKIDLLTQRDKVEIIIVEA